MKKLENLENEKFKISEEELLQIKGGYGGSMYGSFEQYDTTAANGAVTCDSRQVDSCVDW